MKKEKLPASKLSDKVGEPIIQKEHIVHNVGEEFMSWAEKSWALETIITAGLKNIENGGGESCPYKFIRDIFIGKINELAKMTEEEIKKEFQLLIGHKGTEKENDGFVSNAIEIKKK